MSEENTMNIQDLFNERNKQNKRIEELVLEIERLNNIINKVTNYINENWGHWCSNHCKYATETINILQGKE